MQTQSEKAEREAFEKWINNPLMLNRREEPGYYDQYEHPYTAGAWAAWKHKTKESAPA